MTFALLIEALGITPNAAEHGYAIDSMLEMLHWFMLVLFVGWGSFYFYTLWRFQKRKNPKANYFGTTSHLPTKLEGGILVLEVVLLLSFAAPIWADRVSLFPTGPNVIHIHVVGEQFLWNFHYPGPDGKFGRRDITLVSASNPLGLDPTDPDGQDDITTRNVMHIPVNRPCVVDVMSKDVIHDFCIPNMRSAQDAIPGTSIPLWFVPVKTGTYDIVCAQLCGNGHSTMRAELTVESEAAYEKWLDDTSALIHPKKVAEAQATAAAAQVLAAK
jgi:cytochrome c oxidase subunit 2